MLAKHPNQHVLLMALMGWLIDEINVILKSELKDAELEIIKAQYVGDGYPALGIHYFNRQNPEDVGPILEATVERLLSNRSVSQFISYACKSSMNWNEALIKLMTDH